MCQASKRHDRCGCEGSAPASAGEVAARRKSIALTVRPCPAGSTCGSCRSCVSPKHVGPRPSHPRTPRREAGRGGSASLGRLSLLLVALICAISPAIFGAPAVVSVSDGHEDSLDVPAKYLLELMHIPEAGGMSRAKFTHMIEHALTLQMVVKSEMYDIRVPDHAHSHGEDGSQHADDGHDEHEHHATDGRRNLHHSISRSHKHDQSRHGGSDGHDGHVDRPHYEEMSAESLFDAYEGGDGLLDMDELKAAVTEVTGCMLDEHCLPVWEGALERHDAVDVEEDSAAESLVGLKVALAFALMVEDVVGGIFGMFVPTLFGRSSDYIFAVVNMYGGGLFVAIGIMHVLPHATEAQATLGLHNNFPLAGLMVVVGFLLIFYVDRIVSPRHLCLGNRAKIPHNSQAHGSVAPRLGCDDEEQQGAKDTASISTASNGEGWAKSTVRLLERHGTTIALFVSFNLHSVLGDGLPIGLLDSRASVIKMYVAVAAHCIFAAMIMTARFVREGMTKGKAFVWLLFFSIDAPVGVFIGIGLSQVSEVVKTVALAISAGTLVYVGAFEVLSLEFGGHHHETVASVSPEGDSVPQDSPGPEEISLKATMRTKSSGSSARWLRNQLYLAYVLGVLTIALVAFVPHGHGDHDHTHH